jgi:site-specific recombinase XerD
MKHRKQQAQPCSLPLSQWPAADRVAWQEACQRGERLRRGGRASHMKAVTQEDLANRYGLFLDFVQRTQRLESSGAAGAHVIPEYVHAFVGELQQRVRSVTVYGSIYKLRRATEIIAPDHDVSWLKELEKDLDLVKQPQSKMHRLVLAETLVEAGLTLMTEAEAAEHRTRLWRAAMFRNGLMIALLACCPIRLKNFAALTIGESFVQVKNSWWIVLTGSQTKEKRSDERPVPDILTGYIDQYVEHHRKMLDPFDSADNFLWVSRTSQPLSYLGVEKLITNTALLATGTKISPHLFRTSAATTAAINARNMPRLASALLDHRDPRTTEQHYNRASSLSAGNAYLEVLQNYLAP